MLLTLRHLLLTVTLLGVGLGSGALVPDILSVPRAWELPWMLGGSLFALLGLSWPIYRRWHLRPIDLPFCPRCGRRHSNYHVPPEAWPVGILICRHCGQAVRLCLTRVPEADSTIDLPTLCLQWPEFLGVWRKVDLITAPSASFSTSNTAD